MINLFPSVLTKESLKVRDGPAAFWIIYHIYSDPIVLEDIRGEVSKLVVDGSNDPSIDISSVKVSYPILLSTFREVLRFHDRESGDVVHSASARCRHQRKSDTEKG